MRLDEEVLVDRASAVGMVSGETEAVRAFLLGAIAKCPRLMIRNRVFLF